MDMIKSLNLDFTIFVQFFLFLIGYVILTRLVFKPYFSAYLERYNRTTGSEDQAVQIIEETKILEKEYEENAKALNYKIKQIFDDEKKVALTAQEKALKEAQLKSAELLSVSRNKLEESKTKIVKDLNVEIEPLAKLIKETVIG